MDISQVHAFEGLYIYNYQAFILCLAVGQLQCRIHAYMFVFIVVAGWWLTTCRGCVHIE